MDNSVLRQIKNMINENDLEEVYVVGQTTKDQNGDSSEESDTEHDQRRLALPFMMRAQIMRIYDKSWIQSLQKLGQLIKKI